MKQVTAVEWLIQNIVEDQTIKAKSMSEWISIFEQAKEMEKEQIITSWHNGYENQSPMIDENNCGQQYYNEQFKNK